MYVPVDGILLAVAMSVSPTFKNAFIVNPAGLVNVIVGLVSSLKSVTADTTAILSILGNVNVPLAVPPVYDDDSVPDSVPEYVPSFLCVMVTSSYTTV